MKRIKTIIVAAGILFTANTFAQKSIPSPSLSLGVEAGLPLGDFNKTRNVGVGGSLKFAFPVASDMDLTLSGGYMTFSGKKAILGNYSTINMIPVKAGVRYRFPSGFYLEPQLGYTNVKAKGAEDGYGAFTYAANAGFLVNNKLDIGARYEAFSKNENTTAFAGLRLAYNFSL